MSSLRALCVALVLVGCGKSEKPKITVMGSGSGSGSNATTPDVIDASVAVAIDAPAFGKPIATKLAAGGRSTCALLPDATLRCWGGNEHGQLGDGSKTDAPKPIAPKGLTGVKDVVVTGSSVCALTGDGLVKCAGDIGDGKTLLEPTALAGIAGATRFVGQHCVAVANDDVMCWLGFPFVKKTGTPVLVPELAKAVSYGDKFAVFADGSSKFIDEETNKLVASPLAKAVEVQSHAPDDVYCGRFDNGAVKCFGYSMKCKLGLPEAIMTEGEQGGSPFTTKLVELKLPPAKKLALDLSENLCVITSEDRLQCVDVGDASYGNCGKVHAALLESVQFATGRCTVLNDGSVNCVSVDKRRRMMVSAIGGSTGVTQLAVSYTHACALAVTGVYCWGQNDHGQLGQGTIDKTPPPKEYVWKPQIDALQVAL